MKLFKRVIIAIGLTLSLSLVSISLANEVKKVERVASKHKNQPLIKASKKVKTDVVDKERSYSGVANPKPKPEPCNDGSGTDPDCDDDEDIDRDVDTDGLLGNPAKVISN